MHGGAVDEPLLRLAGPTHTPAAGQAAFLQDGLGSVVGQADPTGALVPVYGSAGREPDRSGLVFYRARYYQLGLGRARVCGMG